MATAGETVLIWPGVYRETIRLRRAGSPGRPLILKAAVPGTALISGTAEPALTRSWRWIPLGRRTFGTRVPWRVDGLRVDGVMAFGPDRHPSSTTSASGREPGPLFR